MSLGLKHGWEKLIKEGESLFDYMIHNFETLLDNETKIKHFDIENGQCGLQEYTDEIKEKYFNDIQPELIKWIKCESDTKDLFDYNNWKPFRDPEFILYMFLGYNKIFQYDKYIFLLSLKTDCDNEECECHKTERKNTVHFGLTFFGWKDDRYAKLQPYNTFITPTGIYMPNSWWD